MSLPIKNKSQCLTSYGHPKLYQLNVLLCAYNICMLSLNICMLCTLSLQQTFLFSNLGYWSFWSLWKVWITLGRCNIPIYQFFIDELVSLWLIPFKFSMLIFSCIINFCSILHCFTDVRWDPGDQGYAIRGSFLESSSDRNTSSLAYDCHSVILQK